MMRRVLIACLLLPAIAPAQVPHLRKQGSATQLVVDGKPFLVLGGELHNSSASSLEYMKPLWRKLKDLNLNTVLATVSWELLEPEEGKFDFALVDGLILEARRNNLKLVFLWFGSWKNGGSTYPPMWVKTNLRRFPREQNLKGENIDTLSPFADATRDADAGAFSALMRRIKQVDGQQHTVIMMQVENEVGTLGDARDHSPAAEAAWNAPAPRALMDHLQRNQATLLPEVAGTWKAAGSRASGAWSEVFGATPAAEEIFMAWHLGRYIDYVAAAGKQEYSLPMYVNAWLVQSEGQRPGLYPSGGPVSRVHDIWRAAAPHIDFFAPDIYLPDLKGVSASYTRSGNPLFIPEARGGQIAPPNAFYAIARHDAIGFAPFAIDSSPMPNPLTDAYQLLEELAPAILKHQGADKMTAFLEEKEPAENLALGGYKLRIQFGGMRRGNADPNQKGYGLVVATGPDEFLAAGSGFSVAFAPDGPGPQIAELGYVEEGRFAGGKWISGRRMNGDETSGGKRVSFMPGRLGIQKVRVYRHD